jgi:hypothetical protein
MPTSKEVMGRNFTVFAIIAAGLFRHRLDAISDYAPDVEGG